MVQSWFEELVIVVQSWFEELVIVVQSWFEELVMADAFMAGRARHRVPMEAPCVVNGEMILFL